MKPHDLEAVEGQDVFFPCRVSGVPEPTITWKKLAGKYEDREVEIKMKGVTERTFSIVF